jgi:hypothetical protein
MTKRIKFTATFSDGDRRESARYLQALPALAVVRSRIEHGEFTIVPKRDFGAGPGYYVRGRYVKSGWVVTKNGCNVLPGATWAETPEQALDLLHCYIAAGEGDDKGGKKFWALVRLHNRAMGVDQ